MKPAPTRNSVKDGFRTLATLAIGFGVAMPPAGLALFVFGDAPLGRVVAVSAVCVVVGAIGFIALRLMRRWE